MFTFAGDRIAFVRFDDGTSTLIVARTDGVVVSMFPLPIRLKVQSHWSSIAWLGASRYVLGIEYSHDEQAVVIVDTAKGTVSRPQGLKFTSVSSIDAFADGRYVVLGTRKGRYSEGDYLACYSRNNKELWSWDCNVGYPPDRAGTPFSPDGMAVVGENVAVVGPIDGAINWYDGRTGAFQRSIKLASAWGRPTSYITAVWADRDGGAIVNDFGAKTPYVRVGPDGRQRSAFDTRFPSGARADVGVDGVKYGPGGHLWASDRASIYEVSDQGVVTRTLGDDSRSDALRDIADIDIDPRGDVYALDRRSHVIHVFDGDGRWQRQSHPNPSTFGSGAWDVNLAISQAGRLGILYMDLTSTEGQRYLPYGSDGRPLKAVPLRDASIAGRRSTSPPIWFATFGGIQRLTDHGIVSTLSRRFDRTWLRGPSSLTTAASGEFAVVDMERGYSMPSGGAVVCVYSATGVAERDVAPPTGMQDAEIAFDGHRIVAVQGSNAVCVGLDGKVRWHAALPRGGRPFLVDGARKLYIWTGKLEIDRYAMPKE